MKSTTHLLIGYLLIFIFLQGCKETAFHESNGSFDFGKIVGKSYVNTYFNFKIRLDSIFTNVSTDEVNQYYEWTYCIDPLRVKTDSSLVPFIACPENSLKTNLHSLTPFIRFSKGNSVLFMGSIYLPLLESGEKSLKGFLENEIRSIQQMARKNPSVDDLFLKDKKFKRVSYQPSEESNIDISCAQFGEKYLMVMISVTSDSSTRQDVNAFLDRVEWTDKKN